jgi:hypothetical protein
MLVACFETKSQGFCSTHCKSRSGTARAATHILAHLVMEQNKSGIQVFVVINKKDDDRPGALRQVQKTVCEIIVPSALNFLWLENGNNK